MQRVLGITNSKEKNVAKVSSQKRKLADIEMQSEDNKRFRQS